MKTNEEMIAWWDNQDDILQAKHSAELSMFDRIRGKFMCFITPQPCEHNQPVSLPSLESAEPPVKRAKPAKPCKTAAQKAVGAPKRGRSSGTRHNIRIHVAAIAEPFTAPQIATASGEDRGPVSASLSTWLNAGELADAGKSPEGLKLYRRTKNWGQSGGAKNRVESKYAEFRASIPDATAAQN